MTNTEYMNTIYANTKTKAADDKYKYTNTIYANKTKAADDKY